MDYHWISDDGELARRCEQWCKLPFVTLATEFVRVDTFYPKAGLIQLGDGEQAYLIDPLAITDWSAFARLLTAPGTCKVLHACSEDLEILVRLVCTLPEPLVDTQLAAGFLGLGFGMGYARLVQILLGVELPKGETRSDWLQRPLTEGQKIYAATDVLYLARIYPLLRERLKGRKWDWLLADGAELAAEAQPVAPGQLYLLARQAWKLAPRQLAVLRALCAWREEQAQQRDRPRNHILSEQCLWQLARSMPRDKPALARIHELPPKILRQASDQLLQVIAEAAASPQDSWPARLPAPLPPRVGGLLKRLRKAVEQQAEALGVVPQLMVRKKTLEALLRTGYPDGPYQLPDQLKGWRRELLGPVLLSALAEGDSSNLRGTP